MTYHPGGMAEISRGLRAVPGCNPYRDLRIPDMRYTVWTSRAVPGCDPDRDLRIPDTCYTV